MQNQDHTQREALEVARRLSTLRQEKDAAIARQDFELAAQLRGRELECRSRLQEFPIPSYVLANLNRHTDGTATRNSPVLDLLSTSPGAADATIVEQCPAAIGSPLHLAFAQVPESASGTLRAVLNVDDIFSRHFEPVLPVLSAETITRFDPDRRAEALSALFHELERAKLRGVPTVLSLVAPSSCLDTALQSELLRRLKETRCEFVIFEHAAEITDIAGVLRPEISLVVASSSGE